MNFDFSDDLKQLRDQARRFLSEQCPPAVVRRCSTGRSRMLGRAVARDGRDGLARRRHPGTYGGAGLGYEGLCVLAEELGRAVAPVPFASSAYLAAEAILLAGTEAQKRRLSAEARGRFDRSAASRWRRAPAIPMPGTRPRPRAPAARLTGSKWPVTDGGIADFAIVVARDEAGEIALFLVDLTASGVSRTTLRTVDPTPQPRAHSISTARRRKGWRRRRLGRWCSGCWTARRSCRVRAGRRRRCLPARWRATTRWSAMRSAGRSARSRRSSTSSPMCMSRSNWRARMPITAPGRCRPMPPNCRWPRRPRACRPPRLPSRVQGKHPDPWRHRLHLGRRLPPVSTARSKQLALALGRRAVLEEPAGRAARNAQRGLGRRRDGFQRHARRSRLPRRGARVPGCQCRTARRRAAGAAPGGIDRRGSAALQGLAGEEGRCRFRRHHLAEAFRRPRGVADPAGDLQPGGRRTTPCRAACSRSASACASRR